MKNICLILCVTFCLSKGFAQVAINSTNTAPNPSSMLDIQSVNKGLLIPRFTTSARTGIISPAKGLIVYDSTLSAFFYHTGLVWTQLSTGISTSYWNITGNDVYNNNSGKVGIGTPTPARPLEVAGTGGIQISNGAYSSSDNELFFSDNGQIRSLDNFHRIVFNRSSDQLEFHEFGSILFKTGNPLTEAMRVTTNGRIGIGTNNPGAKLHVIDAINSPALLVESGSGTTAITLNNSGGGLASILFEVNSTFKATITSNSGGDLYLTTTNGIMILKANGNVGMGTYTPDASAILDLGGTTKGFLLPRMSPAQRALIDSPSEGLVIYNTSTKKPNYFNGTQWMNYDGTFALNVGDPYQGGIIGYILKPGDLNYIPGEFHGIIAAPSDLEGLIQWGCYGTLIFGANGYLIGTGYQNTLDITANCSVYYSCAAWSCKNLLLGGYNDWFLPNTRELYELYLQRNIIGGFTGDYYLTSTQQDANNAFSQNFIDGLGYASRKDIYDHVRAVRSF